MNATSTPEVVEPRNALIASADEQLAHAHEQIARADQELSRLSEQLAKMERDATRPASAKPVAPSPGAPPPGPQSRPKKSALRGLVGLLLAACIVTAALVLQSSYGREAKRVAARWAPQLVSTPSLPPSDASPVRHAAENAPPPAQSAPSVVQVAAAETATPAAAPAAPPAAPPQATPPAQTAPQAAPPVAAAAPPEQTQLLQTMARDLANLQREIEQLKANQQQIASDNAKAVEQLKASQEEIKGALAKVSEPKLPRTSSLPPPPTQPAPAVRKPERTLPSPYARARPRILRQDWIDDDW
jgi:hypothetical protein